MTRLLRNLAVYAFHLLFARPVLYGLAGARFRGRSRIPDGACLVVSNHNSHLDAAVLMTLFPLRRLPDVHPVAAADYFGRNWFWRTMGLLLMNGVPIARKPARGEDSLAPIAQRLQAGESLIFFPEGSRGEAGVVAKFRPGIGRLVQAVPGLLVVPVYLAGPERVWPRGGALPVPLTVVAHVGRPRTYDAALDPRDIAERVRDDVLALAPPPTPVPGEANRPPLRVAVCGVDDSRRKAVFRATVGELGREGSTLGISSMMLQGDADGVREASGPIPARRSQLEVRLLSAVFPTRGRYRGVRFVDMVERAQVDEAIERAREIDFAVQDGSVLLDLLVGQHADLHRRLLRDRGPSSMLPFLARQKRIPSGRWMSFLRRAPEIWLINVFNLVEPPAPDVVVLLRSSVGRLMERQRAGGVKIEPHQRERFLERLQGAYREAAELLRKKKRTELLELDGDTLEPEEAAHRIRDVCLERARERSAADG